MDTLGDFRIQAMSDADYDDLIVEVLHKGEFCLLISQEAGFEDRRVAIQPRWDGQPWDFAMKDFQAVLEAAASRLWELRKQPGGSDAAGGITVPN